MSARKVEKGKPRAPRALRVTADDIRQAARMLLEDLNTRNDRERRLLTVTREMAEALRPFAHFWQQWERSPIGKLGDEFYGIHVGTAHEAVLSRSDCRRAAEALATFSLLGGIDDR